MKVENLTMVQIPIRLIQWSD